MNRNACRFDIAFIKCQVANHLHYLNSYGTQVLSDFNIWKLSVAFALSKVQQYVKQSPRHFYFFMCKVFGKKVGIFGFILLQFSNLPSPQSPSNVFFYPAYFAYDIELTVIWFIWSINLFVFVFYFSHGSIPLSKQTLCSLH